MSGESPTKAWLTLLFSRVLTVFSDSGYQCVRLVRRDESVLELYLGKELDFIHSSIIPMFINKVQNESTEVTRDTRA